MRRCAQPPGSTRFSVPPVGPAASVHSPCPASSTASSALSCAASPSSRPGDRVRVHFQVVEGTRRRTQVFEGMVIKRQGSGAARDLHRPQAVVRRGRGAHVPGALAEDRAHRGSRPRRRAPRQALLPARPRGPRRPRARAPLDGPGRGGLRGRRDAARRGAARPARRSWREARAAGRRRGSRGAEGEAAEARSARRSEARRSPRTRPPTRPTPAGGRRPEEPARGRRRRRTPSAADERRRAAGRRRRGSPPDETSRLGPVARSPWRAQRRRAPAAPLVELVTIVAVALGLALGIQAFLVKPFRIPSESMVPTLEIGQRVLVDRVSFRFSDPDRGDIVVFKPPAGADTNACGVEHSARLGLPAPDATAARTRTSSSAWWPWAATASRSIDGSVYSNGKRQQTEPFAQPRLDLRAPATCRRRSRSRRATTS